MGYKDRSDKKQWRSKPWKGNNQKNENTQDVKGTENYFKGGKPDPSFDKTKQFRCFECGDTVHFRPECSKIKSKNNIVILNHVTNKVDEDSIHQYQKNKWD